MEANNISYLILGIIIGSSIDFKLIFGLVILFAVITNEPDFKGMRPRALIASILYGIYLFILNFFYHFSKKPSDENQEIKELNRIQDVKEFTEIKESNRIQEINQFNRIQEIKEIKEPLTLIQKPNVTPKPIILNFSPISIYPAMKFDKK